MRLLMGKAYALYGLRRYLEVISTAQLVTPGDEINAEAWTIRGAALLELERYSDAVLACDHALIVAPEEPFALECKARAEFAR